MDSKKTQKIVVVILVITILLGIVGAIIVYYLSTQDGTRDVRTGDDMEYCACITAYTTPTCNDCSCAQIEAQTLESQIGEVIDGVCSLDCETETIDLEEESPQTISCLIAQVRGDNCHSISIRDTNSRELIIPPITTERPIFINANFVPGDFNGENEEFTKFVFVINGESSEINASDVPSTVINGQTTYLPELEFSNFQDIDTLTIQATAQSDKSPDGTPPSKYCYKQYDLQQERGPFCSNLRTETQIGSQTNTTVIDRLELNTPNLTQNNDISIEFDFDHDSLDSVRTTVIPQDLLEEILVNETIFLEYSHLYSTPSLFTDSTGFPIFDSVALDTNTITITAQLYIDNIAIDSGLCTENVPLFGGDEEEKVIEKEEEEKKKEEEEEEITRADLQLTMEGPTCVRKAIDANTISRTNYRITIQNNSDSAETIESIKNKLPLGFKYVENTTSINGTLISDNIQEITSVGESQDILWTGDWIIQPNTALIVEYGVNITVQALDGENQNEAIATPVNVPENMDKLRAEFVTMVSDECEHQEDLPDTGTLTFLSFAIGIFVLILGIFIYQGRIDIIDQAILKLINAKVIKKNLLPKEYFEESILEKEEEKD